MTEPTRKTCPRCGARFVCGAPGACWCADLPPLAGAQLESDCLCPECLGRAIAMERARSIVEQRLLPAKDPPKAFTLIELLVTIAVIGILAGLFLPVLARSKLSAQRAECVSNLRELGIAAELYWDDNGGNCFSWVFAQTNYGATHWFGWIGPGAEGQRAFDLSQGALYPYLDGSDVRLCPSLGYALAQFKLKADGVVFSYGYNFYLSSAGGQPPVNYSRLRHPAQTALFADAAQVNNFQAPASPSNPMLEEWYYVDLETNYGSVNNYPNGHFRHSQKANVNFCDGHTGLETYVPGSIDPKLPGQFVAQLAPGILTLP